MPNIKQSATDFIKQHNPQNLSEVFPTANELINNLKMIPKLDLNPKMIDAVGANPLGQLMQLVQQRFFAEIVKKIKELEKKGIPLSPEQQQQSADALTVAQATDKLKTGTVANGQ